MAEVGLPPVAARALALLDDQRDGGPGGIQAGDRYQLRPAEHLAARLRAGWADEHARLAMAVDQLRETVLDAAIQMADSVIVLRGGHQRGRGCGQRPALADGRESFGVL